MRKNSFRKFIKKLFSKMGLTIMTALLLCAVGLGTGIGLSLRNNTSQSNPKVESGYTKDPSSSDEAATYYIDETNTSYITVDTTTSIIYRHSDWECLLFTFSHWRGCHVISYYGYDNSGTKTNKLHTTVYVKRAAIGSSTYSSYKTIAKVDHLNKDNDPITYSNIFTSDTGYSLLSGWSDGNYQISVDIYGDEGFLGINDWSESGVCIASFKIDNTKPTLTASSTLTNGSVTLTASDNFSGISEIQYKKTSASSWSTYSSAISTEGTYVAQAVDKAGNYSTEVTFTIDKTAPTITPSGGITSNSTSTKYTNASVTLKVSDTSSSSTLYYGTNTSSLSSKTASAGSSSSVTISTDGTYYYYAVDAAGNRRPSSGYYTFTLDKTNPTLTASSTLTNGSVTLTASDAGTYSSGISKIQYKKTSASSWSTYSSAISTEGTYVARALDKAGNYSAEVTFTIDKTSPTITPSGGITSNSTTPQYTTEDVTLTFTDTLYYGASTSTLTADTSGSITISDEGRCFYYAIDSAGNRLPSSGYYRVAIDRTGPTFNGVQNTNGVTINNNSTSRYGWTITTSNFTDSLSGVRGFMWKYSSSDTWSSEVTSHTVPYYASGKYTYKVYDELGNSAEYSLTLYMDNSFWINVNSSGWEGSGTSSSPYLISSASDLARLAKLVNIGSSYGPNGVKSSFVGKYFKLTKDIDLSAHYWVPIGIGDVAFSGNFNGGGYTISGLKTITNANSAEEYDYAGFFGKIEASSTCTIQNLKLTNIFVCANKYAGGVVGWMKTSSGNIGITNSYVEGTVSSGEYAGGIIGYIADGGEWYITVGRGGVAFEGKVTGGNSEKTGGIIGYSLVVETTVTIGVCSVYGLISGDLFYNGNVAVGSGIVGTNFNSDGSVKAKEYEIPENSSSTQFSGSTWFYSDLAGGMPLLRRFYWVAGSVSSQSDIQTYLSSWANS